MDLIVRPLKCQWMRITTWMYCSRSMHNHKSAHRYLLWGGWASNSQWVPAWRHPIFLFLYSVLPLSELRWPTNPRGSPCRWSRVAVGRALCHLCGAGRDMAGHSDESLSLLWPHVAGYPGGVTWSPLLGCQATSLQVLLQQAGTKEPLWMLQYWVNEIRDLHHFRLNIFLLETGQCLSLHKEVHGKDGGRWNDGTHIPSLLFLFQKRFHLQFRKNSDFL